MAESTELQKPVKPKKGGRGRPWKPGQSGNPGGRCKEAADVKVLAREHGPDAIKKLAELLNSKDGKTAVAAARELLDRGYGRAPQDVTISAYEAMPTGRLLLLVREAMAVLEAQAEPEEESQE